MTRLADDSTDLSHDDASIPVVIVVSFKGDILVLQQDYPSIPETRLYTTIVHLKMSHTQRR